MRGSVEDSADRPPPARTPIDPERLERILIEAAREGRPVSYRQVLDLFGHRVGSGSVGNLCRVLGVVDRARAVRGIPELACLVVRAADGQPGAGYFSSEDTQDGQARVRPSSPSSAGGIRLGGRAQPCLRSTITNTSCSRSLRSRR